MFRYFCIIHHHSLLCLNYKKERACVSSKGKMKNAWQQKKLVVDRRRNVLVLGMEFLRQNCLNTTFEALQRESGKACSHFAPAAAINLLHIFNEFEAYHKIKHNRPPTYFKKEERKKRKKKNGSSRGNKSKDNGQSVNNNNSLIGSDNNDNSDNGKGKNRKSLRRMQEEAKKTPVFHQPHRKHGNDKTKKKGDQTDSGSEGLCLSVSVGQTVLNNRSEALQTNSTTKDAARARRQRRMQYNPLQMPDGLNMPLALKGRSTGSVAGAAGSSLRNTSRTKQG